MSDEFAGMSKYAKKVALRRKMEAAQAKKPEPEKPKEVKVTVAPPPEPTGNNAPKGGDKAEVKRLAKAVLADFTAANEAVARANDNLMRMRIYATGATKGEVESLWGMGGAVGIRLAAAVSRSSLFVVGLEGVRI